VKRLIKILKIFGILILCIVIVLVVKTVFEDELKGSIKKYYFSKIIKNEELLNEAVAEILENAPEIETIGEKRRGIGIDHEELGLESVDKLFQTFRLCRIKNRAVQPEGAFISFDNVPYLEILWDGYSYGFYYSVNDEPVDVHYTHEKCEEEFDGRAGFTWDYHYKTERIVENWWYYEVTIYLYPSPHRTWLLP